MLAELIIGQERISITPKSTFKWAKNMLINAVVPYTFNMLACIYFWKTYIFPPQYEMDKVLNVPLWDLYYILIGILFCIFRYRKTMILKPNIGKRTAQYTIMLLFNTFVLAFFLLFYGVFINDGLASYIHHIARVSRYTYEQLDILYVLLPSFGGYNLLRTFIAYQVTRFLFDKNIRVK